MPNFTSNQLKAVAAADRLRSITRAAKELGLSQPAISKAIQELETGLGYPLFDRIPGGVKPSARGVKAIPIIEQILSAQHQISAEIADACGKAQQKICLGATFDISTQVLESIFQCLSLFFAIDTYTLRLIRGEDISRLLSGGELDCIVFAACTTETHVRSTPVMEAYFGFLHSPKVDTSLFLNDDIKRSLFDDRSAPHGRNLRYKIICLSGAPHSKNGPLLEIEHLDLAIKFLHTHTAVMGCTGLEAARDVAKGLQFTPVDISAQPKLMQVGVPRGPASTAHCELLREVLINGILNAPWPSYVRPFAAHRRRAPDPASSGSFHSRGEST